MVWFFTPYSVTCCHQSPQFTAQQDGHRVCYNLMCRSEADVMEGIPKDSAVLWDLWVRWQSDFLHLLPVSTTKPAFSVSKKAGLKSWWESELSSHRADIQGVTWRTMSVDVGRGFLPTTCSNWMHTMQTDRLIISCTITNVCLMRYIISFCDLIFVLSLGY